MDCRSRVVEDMRGDKWVPCRDDGVTQRLRIARKLGSTGEKSLQDSLTGLFAGDAAGQSVNRAYTGREQAPGRNSDGY